MMLSEHLKVLPFRDTTLLRVWPKSNSKLKQFLDNNGNDEFAKRLAPTLRKLLSPNYYVLTDQQSWQKLSDEHHTKGTDGRIYLLSMLSEAALRGTTILAANVESSLVYHWLKLLGVHLRTDDELQLSLRNASSVGNRLAIRYFIKGQSFSKYLAAKRSEGSSLIDRMDSLALDAVAGAPLLYVGNKNRPKPDTTEWSKVLQIPTFAHGLNKFDRYHNIYFSAALNREPKHFKREVCT